MATTTTQHHDDERWECDYCGDDHLAHTFFNAAMCSEACERLDRVDTLLNIIQHDHRLCFSCGRQLKTLEKPPKGTTVVIGPCRHSGAPKTAKDVLMGYEHLTENADRGDISIDVVDSDDPYATDNQITTDRAIHGVVCRCGSTDHRDADPTIRRRYALEIAHHLQETIAELRLEDKTDEHLRRDVHFERLISGDTHREALSKALVL